MINRFLAIFVSMKGLLFLFFILLEPFFLFGQETDKPKTDIERSWGVGAFASSNSFLQVYGLTLFYQKEKNQYELDIFSRYNENGFSLIYGFYPNEWKKRLDIRVETGINFVLYQSNYLSSRIRPFAGYGMRLRLLKHFFLTHQANLGLMFTDFRLNQDTRYKYDATFDINIGLSFNLGSIRWKRK
jgi:hypothetical protein